MKYYEIDFTVHAPAECMADACDLVAACAGETGFETFEETEKGLKGYVQTTLFSQEALDEALADFPIKGVTIDYTVNEAEDKDWNEAWENEGFTPIVVDGRCAIHDGRHLPDTTTPITVEIDARLAFGTGTHQTTRMIVGVLTSMPLKGLRMLDAGCGTGILGIVALKCGAASVTGYDIDEWSADNARHNAVINQVDSRFTSLLGDASVIATLQKPFDIVTANINRNILLQDMPAFSSALHTGGTLVLSGFYTDDIPPLTETALTLGLQEAARHEDDGWACLVLVKKE